MKTRNLLTIIGVALALPSLASAQGASAEPITLKDLKTPASPAFQLLGVAPTDIERPTTPRGVATTLLSALQKSDTLLPNGFAMEVSPYWLVSHPKLEFSSYMMPAVAQSISQTFSVSVAVTKAAAADAATNAIDIGVGFRTSPLFGNPTTETKRLAIVVHTSAASDSMIDALIALIPDAGQLPSDVTAAVAQLERAAHPGVSDGDYKIIFDGVRVAVSGKTSAEARVALNRLRGDETRKKAAQDLQTASQRRVGVTLDVAGALVTRTTDLQDSRARLTRGGVWATGGYSGEYVSALGLGRYIRNSDDPLASSDLFDTGGRISASIHDFTASFEAIHRRDVSTERVLDSATKATVTLEYKVSEDLSVTSTFGKDFDDTHFGHKASTITLLGVSLGLGQRPNVSANK